MEKTKTNKTNICLNMIVKNETKVLPRLFKSVHNYIDYYVIVDTGSSDGTPDLIKSEMKKYGIPGEIHHHDWVDFGYNRQIALEYAVAANKADWLLFIDADEELDVSISNFYKYFEPGVSYRIEKHHDNFRYAVPHIVDISQNQWEWKGVVHNYLISLTNGEQKTIKDPRILYHPDEGAKSQGVSKKEKYLRDARMLEEEIKKHPDDARSQFYLAQSYRDAGSAYQQKAYDNYLKRSQMTNGWMDENYISLVESGRLSNLLGKPYAEAIILLLSAYELRPKRAEALFYLARICRLNNTYHQAYMFAKMATTMDIPYEGLFIDKSVYQWKRWDELAVLAGRAGRYEESLQASNIIMTQLDSGLELDSSVITNIKSNLKLAKKALKKTTQVSY